MMWTRLKHKLILLNSFFKNHTFCVFVRISLARRFLQISKTYIFLKNNMGLSMKKYTIRWFLCRQNWRYNEFCCYNECRYKESSLWQEVPKVYLLCKNCGNLWRCSPLLQSNLNFGDDIDLLAIDLKTQRSLRNCHVEYRSSFALL